MPVQLLCAADLHLGRPPSQLNRPGTGFHLASSGGWDNLVRHAVAADVDLVVLAGDVVDERNRSFEAWGLLDRGLATLAAAGIPVVAVAGNHDHDSLPDLVREIGRGRLHLVGANGQWERWTLRADDGTPRLHIDGWSFRGARWGDDPTASYGLARDDRTPTIGLLHCDLDGPAGSPYAPVATSALRALPPAAWILGHIHVPRLRDEPGVAPVLYPGSLQALDPGEPGRHGAWQVEVSRAGRCTFTPVALSPSRYETVEVDLEGADAIGEVQGRVRAALARRLTEIVAVEGGHLRALHCRVRLTGRTALHNRLHEALEKIDDFDPSSGGDARLVVDPRPLVDTRPALDLEQLARGSDAPAQLAQLILTLTDPDATPDEALSDRVHDAVADVHTRNWYHGIGRPDTPPDGAARAVRERMRRQAGRLLDALMATPEDA